MPIYPRMLRHTTPLFPFSLIAIPVLESALTLRADAQPEKVNTSEKAQPKNSTSCGVTTTPRDIHVTPTPRDLHEYEHVTPNPDT